MNNWFRSVLAELSDGPKLIGALFVEAKDVSEELCLRYLEFLKRLISLSIPVVILGIVFFILSNIFGYAPFNFIGVLLITLLTGCWILALQPAVMISEQLARISAFDRLFKRILYSIAILLLVLLFAFNSPAGTDGLKTIGSFILLLLGCMLVGIRFTRKAIGVKFISASVICALFLYFPLATNNISTVIADVDRGIFNKFIPSSSELDMSLVNLSGKSSSAPRLFPKDDKTVPLWWCRKDAMSVAEYRCFDQSGRDPTTNEELIPISLEIIRHATNRLLEENRRVALKQTMEKKQVALQQAMEKKQVALQQAEDAALTEQARVKALNEKKNDYIGKYLATGGNRVGVAIAFLKNQSLDNAFAQQIQARIPNLSSSYFLTQQASSDGVFSRVFAGDKSEFAKLELSRVADRIMVGKITEHFENNRMIPGVTNSIIDADVRIFDVKTGHIIKSGRFSSDVIAGYSQSEAQKKAQDEVITQIVNNIISSL